MHTLEYKPLGILAHGETRTKARKAFITELMTLWEAIVEEPDTNLTKDAQVLKSKLLKLIVKPDPDLITKADKLVEGVI